MKALKFMANLLSLATISLIIYLLTLFLKSITVTQSAAQYTEFGVWFWGLAILLILLNTFTDIQIIFEDWLSRFKFFNSKSE